MAAVEVVPIPNRFDSLFSALDFQFLAAFVLLEWFGNFSLHLKFVVKTSLLVIADGHSNKAATVNALPLTPSSSLDPAPPWPSAIELGAAA